jgi:hypothetical protein
MPLDLFSYISDLDKNLKLKSNASKPEDYCTPEAVNEALKVICSHQL